VIIILEAERRLGQMLKTMEKNKGVRLSGRDNLGGIKLEPPTETPTLRELGIDKKTSSEGLR